MSTENVTSAHIGAWISPGGVIAPFISYFIAFAGVLPVVIGSAAGLAAMFYYITQSLQSPDVRAWLKARRERKHARKVAKLQYRQSVLVGELKQLGVLTHAEVTTTDVTQKTNIEVQTPPAPKENQS